MRGKFDYKFKFIFVEEFGILTNLIIVLPGVALSVIVLVLIRYHGEDGTSLDWSSILFFLSIILSLIDFVCSLVRVVCMMKNLV